MIKLAQSTFYNEEKTKKALCDFLMKAEQLSMGDEVAKFEINFAKWNHAKYAVMVSSGSMANLVLLQSLMNLGYLKKGDKVGITAVTWATNAMPIIQLGMEPVPIDIDEVDMCTDIGDLESKMKGLSAFFNTNILGFGNSNMTLREVCLDHDVLFLEDNCESLGSQVMGNDYLYKLGTKGFGNTFSFFVGHHLSTIEGGMILTDDQELAVMLRMVRAHGWGRNIDDSRLRVANEVSDFNAKYTFYDLGYNARPTEIQGFLGNEQLQYLDTIVEKRHKNFFKMGGSDIYAVDRMCVLSNMAFPLLASNRDEIIQKCKELGIECRPLIAGNITQQPFWKKYCRRYSLSSSNLVQEHGLYLPNHEELTDNDLDKICEIIKLSKHPL